MKYIIRFINAIFIFLLACMRSIPIIWENPVIILILAAVFICVNFFPSKENRSLPTRRLRICGDGCELLILFLLSTILTITYLLLNLHQILSGTVLAGVIAILIPILVEAVIFWNGIIRVYLVSAQLGMKWRIIGILCGAIPIAQLVALGYIIRIVSQEVSLESSKIELNAFRQEEHICKTQYPLLLVHGVFFRDFKYFNYWGRVPKELEQNGAQIFYGNHQSASSVTDSAQELAERIRQILETTGCEKVNIIAHSKGGLDCRYAISQLGIAPYVASLTTINTPHRGCEFADFLLNKAPDNLKNTVANGYNAALHKLGDSNPDFIAAVTDLTASACLKRNQYVLDEPGIFYQSVGSKLNHPSSGRFPLNFSTRLVGYFDGPNDGLVGARSFPWGETYQFLTVNKRRGISHGDMIDLNRENIAEFDVREFYVQLVSDLRERGF